MCSQQWQYTVEEHIFHQTVLNPDVFLHKPCRTFAAFADFFQKSSKERAHYFRGGAKNDETARLPVSKQMANFKKS